MFVETIPVGVFRCNCTIIACERTRKAIVVDPGDEPDEILSIIRANDLDVTLLVHTHAHLDHIMGAFSVAEATGAPARLHEGDRQLWDNVEQVAASYHIPTPKLPPLAPALVDDEAIRFGDAVARVIHTPGHTMGSCCFCVDLENGRQLLLTGDTLFRGKIGFACQPYRSTATLVASIRNRLLTLEDDTRVIPGHGPMTEIGIERRRNPYIA
jgi:glyoxylase-like metal-dependent hydrolase (beta-lactamase superfamily II)